MLKKILAVFMVISILWTSSLMQVNRVNAVGLTGALGAGAAAAGGPYVIAGLLVAAGGAVLVGANDEDIQRKAQEIWDRTSDGFKQGFQDAMYVSGQAWDGTVEFSDAMKAELEGFAGEVGDWLHDKLKGHEGKDIDIVGSYKVSTSIGQYGIADFNPNAIMVVNGIAATAIHLWRNSSLDWYATISPVDTIEYGGSFTVIPFTQYKDNDEKTFIKTAGGEDLSAILSLLASYGASISWELDAYISAPPSVITGNWVQGLQGINEIDMPLDQWLAGATTVDGIPISIDSTTGLMTLPDGTIYDGDIKLPWSIPKGATGTFPDVTVNNPSVPVDDVFTGNPTTTNPPTTGDGILQGLWDWLKGILNSILNAIKALLALVGVTALVQSIVDMFKNLMQKWDDARSAPKKKVDFSKLKVAAATFTTVFPFSIPWDVFRAIDVLNVAPKAPLMKVDAKETVQLAGKSIPIHYKFDLDLSTFDAVAAIGRWALILIFDIAIILALRRLTPD